MDRMLEVVVIPVTAVDRAKHLNVDQVDFICDVYHQPNEQFWVVQMTPRWSGCSIIIGIGLSKAEPGSVKGMRLCVEDIDAAHAHLAATGVECMPVRHIVTAERIDGHGGPWNSFVPFDDPDGNSWAVH